jgi:hypothetical protein
MQAPQDSFTVSGSTIVFASTLASTDSIDFIMALGDVLDIGTPSDGTVTTAKIQDDAITSAKIAGALTTTGTTGIGIGQEPHSTAAVGITTTDQHIRMTNGSELGILSVESDGNIQLWSHGDDATQFRTGSGSGTIAARIDADGLKFGTNTAAANALNEYEEGDFVPTITTSGGTTTYVVQKGAYTRIGRVCHVMVNLVAVNNSNVTLYNLNLPFTAGHVSSGTSWYPTIAIGNFYNINLTGGGTMLGAYAINGQAAARLHSCGNNTNQLAPSCTANTNFEVRFEGSFIIQ